jgi:DMSO/TMAO reductase YedYZ heme-binding membrane subunit
MDIKIKLSTLWIVVMLNLIFADILSIIVELVNKNTLGDILGEVTTAMAIAAILTNIPIFMIYFSRELSYKINRSLNITTAILTLIYVVGGGSLTPHYIICGAIEVIVLLYIIKTSWKWVEHKI